MEILLLDTKNLGVAVTVFQGELYPFQQDHIARAYVQGMRVAFNWDTGLGKSVAALQSAALLFEDGKADLLLLVCERNKLHEWKEDVEKFTTLTARIHHGANRKLKMIRDGMPDVLISTYETFKADLAKWVKNGRTKVVRSNELLDEVSVKKPMVVFDEADKLRNRKSGLYKSFFYVLKTLTKKNPEIPVLMLTATPISKDWENSFNILHMLAPDAMPNVTEFEKEYVRTRNIYGKALYYTERMSQFRSIAAPLILTKRKTDPDVMEQFPKKTERAAWISMESDQQHLYTVLSQMDEPGMFTVLRQVCAHPSSLLAGEGKYATSLRNILGEDYIRSLSSAKTQWLVDYLSPIVQEQGEKAVVFTFFGQSVLPILAEELRKSGLEVFTYHGALSDKEKEEHKHLFKTGAPSVFLTSDSGAKGINLPEASHLVEYDMAPTFGLREQRLNRISRIGQGGPTITIRSMILRDTIEVPLMYTMLKGNKESDQLLGKGMSGGNFMTAQAREMALLAGFDTYLESQTV